jgi:hypothetical protein
MRWTPSDQHTHTHTHTHIYTRARAHLVPQQPVVHKHAVQTVADDLQGTREYSSTGLGGGLLCKPTKLPVNWIVYKIRIANE